MVNRSRNNRLGIYGFPRSVGELAPQPIIADRAPTASDVAPLATQWVDKTNDNAYTLTSVTAGSANWAITQAAGAVVTSLTVTGGTNDVTVATGGTTTISSATIDFDAAGGTTTITNDLVVGGTVGVTGTTTLVDLTVTGDLDITTAALFDITSTSNTDPAILLRTNGGTTETMQLTVSQGTSVDSLDLQSVAGGITLDAGIASADAINITASNAAGGIDMDSGTAGTILDSTGAISLDAAAASNFNVTGAGVDLTLGSAAGRVIVDGGEDAAQVIYLHADAGTSETIHIHSDQGTGVDSVNIASDVGGITIDGGVASADAVNITSSDAAGGVDIDSGTAGTHIDSTGAISLDAAAASNFSTSGAGVDLDLASAAGRVIVTAGEDAAQAIYLHADAGTSETIHIHSDQGTGVASVNVTSDVGGITLDSGLASADAINITSSNAGGGVDIDSGTAGTHMDSTGAISLDAAAASNFSVSGAGVDLDLASAAGRIIATAGEDAAQAIYLHADAGTAETIHIHSDQGTGVDSVNITSDVGGITLDSGLASADAINITSSDAAGGVDIDSGTAGSHLDSTGAISLDAAAASNFTVTGAGVDLTLDSAAGRVVVNGEEAAANAITLLSAAGGIDVDGALQVNIASSQNAADALVLTSSAGGIDITATGAAAGEDIDIVATGSSVNVTSTEATADAIVLNASDAAGGIDLTTGGGAIDLSSAGNVSMVPATATEASPTATATINARVFKATFTGFTTASGATQAFTVTNSAFAAGDGVMVTVSNAGSNDAKMSLERVDGETSGTLIVHTQNNGAAALNGNVVITGWIID